MQVKKPVQTMDVFDFLNSFGWVSERNDFGKLISVAGIDFQQNYSFTTEFIGKLSDELEV